MPKLFSRLIMPVAIWTAAGLCACDQSEREDPSRSVSSSTSGDTDASGIHTGVKGRVMTADDKPVVGAVVLPESRDNPAQAIPEMAAVTNEHGEYQWPLRPGSYSMSVTAQGFESMAKPVEVEQGQLATLNFTLTPAR
jgi:hypothetical protein